MKNGIVKAIIDSSKQDTIEFQMLPGFDIEEGDCISYDKMTGMQFRVTHVYNDILTCSIIGYGESIYNLRLQCFLPGTILFNLNIHAVQFND